MAQEDIRDPRFGNFNRALSKFVVGYNKSIVLHNITSDSMDIAGRTIQEVRDSLGDVVATFEEIQATSQNTAVNTDSINDRMSKIVQQNDSLGEDLNERAEEISGAKSDSEEMNELFESLTEKSKEIKEMTAAIQDVSDRTNILSINASIEAARAGEAGSGFRIIAGEVKDLSQQTNEFAETIADRMEEFTQTMNQVAEYVRDFTGILEKFSQDIQRINENFGESRREGDEVGNALKEIAAANNEESQAISMGLQSLEDTFNSLNNTHTMIQTLKKTYEGLDRLLDRER
jgi:methyl-accepting chemotaxis protein